MIKVLLQTLSLLLFCQAVFASEISGRITDESGQALPFASIYVRGTTLGTSSNPEGFYNFELEPGNYALVFQYVGYKDLIRHIELNKTGIQLNVVLEPEDYQLAEVVVSADAEDPAYRVMREAIKKRKYYRDLVEGFQCDVYIKGNQKFLDAPEKILGQELGDFGGSLDSNRQGIVYLSESVSKLYYQRPDQYKELMISSKVSGNDNGFSYNQARLMNFSFYDNKIDLGRPIISPIATNAMLYYRFRMEGTFYDKDGRLINKIEVIPRKALDPVFRGYIYIVEDLWNIHSTELFLTKESTKISVLDTLMLNQVHVPLSEENWMMLSQTIRFRISVFGFVIAGYFTGVFNNYELNPTFEKGFFTNEVFTVEEEANKRDRTYWLETRPIPLTEEEDLDYVKKDSLQVVWKSKYYLDSVDARNNRFKPLSILTGYSYNRSFKKSFFSFEPPLNTLQFNAVHGFNLALNMSYKKEFDDINANFLEISPSIQYGFSDQKLRAKAEISYQLNRTDFTRFKISGGYFAEQFNPSAITPSLNTSYALFSKQNFMKLYDKRFAKADFRKEIFNGVLFFAELEYADRRPLENNSNYSFKKKKSEIPYASNHPLDPEDFSPFFERHQALLVDVHLRLRYKQKYIKYPDRKFIIGSKVPDLWVHYQRGIPLFGAEADYDLLKLQIMENIRMGLGGTSRLNAISGWFLSKKSLEFIDYQHFNGNQTIFATTNQYLRGYQLLPYYDYSTPGSFLQIHYAHHFEGFIWNKLPGLKKLGFQTVAGVHYLYTREKGSYYEINFGIENIGWKIFRFLRVDFVAGFPQNEPWQHRFVIGIDIPDNQ